MLSASACRGSSTPTPLRAGPSSSRWSCVSIADTSPRACLYCCEGSAISDGDRDWFSVWPAGSAPFAALSASAPPHPHFKSSRRNVTCVIRTATGGSAT